MKGCLIGMAVWLAVTALGAGAPAQQVEPMVGGHLLEGYTFSEDEGPKGSMAYDPAGNTLKGYYSGLKLPLGRRAIFAWLYDTKDQRALYLGAVGLLNPEARSALKQEWGLTLPADFKGGRFGDYEIIGFSAEDTARYAGGEVKDQPEMPRGIAGNPRGSPVFYLFAALPGAQTERHYCGHGRDFFFATALPRQICYECACGQKTSACKAAGLALHQP